MKTFTILAVTALGALACGAESPESFKPMTEAYRALCSGGAPNGLTPALGAGRVVIVNSNTGRVDAEYGKLPGHLKARTPDEARFVACLERSERSVGHYEPGNIDALQRVWSAQIVDLASGESRERIFWGSQPPQVITGADNTLENETYGDEPKGDFRAWVRDQAENR